jgi:hypothetical protein
LCPLSSFIHLPILSLLSNFFVLSTSSLISPSSLSTPFFSSFLPPLSPPPLSYSSIPFSPCLSFISLSSSLLSPLLLSFSLSEEENQSQRTTPPENNQSETTQIKNKPSTRRQQAQKLSEQTRNFFFYAQNKNISLVEPTYCKKKRARDF